MTNAWLLWSHLMEIAGKHCSRKIIVNVNTMLSEGRYLCQLFFYVTWICSIEYLFLWSKRSHHSGRLTEVFIIMRTTSPVTALHCRNKPNNFSEIRRWRSRRIESCKMIIPQNELQYEFQLVLYVSSWIKKFKIPWLNLFGWKY